MSRILKFILQRVKYTTRHSYRPSIQLYAQTIITLFQEQKTPPFFFCMTMTLRNKDALTSIGIKKF